MDSLHSSRVSTRGGYSAEQLEAIKLFGKKDLSFGCWLFIQNPDGYAQFIEESDVGNGFTIMSATDGYSILNDKKDNIKDYEILGHIPHLEDLFRACEERGLYCAVGSDGSYIAIRNDDYTIDEDFYFDSNLQFLDQRSLPEIISLFK